MGNLGWVSVSAPYVTPRSRGEREAWGAEAAEHGGVGTQRLLDVSEVLPAVEVAEALQVEPGMPVVLRQRVMLLDGRPVEVTNSFYPVSVARGTGLAELRKIRGGAVTLLAELGFRPRKVSEDVYARQPTPHERTLLELGDHEWVLGLTRLLSTEEGTPVEMSVMTMTAEGRRLRYQLSVD